MSDGDEGATSFRVLPFDSLDSTNEEARRQLRAGAGDGTVIWARTQQAGRGRRGRAWVSDSGNLFCSVIVRPECPPAEAAQVSLATALAVAETAEAALAVAAGPEGAIQIVRAPGTPAPGTPAPGTPVKGAPVQGTPAPRALVQVKWPNDVLVGGRKLAGILLESDMAPANAADSPGRGPARAASVASLVVGVGINIGHAPEGTEFPATSLVREGAAELSAAAVLDIFLGRFGFWYRRWRREGLMPVRGAWRAGDGALAPRNALRQLYRP